MSVEIITTEYMAALFPLLGDKRKGLTLDEIDCNRDILAADWTHISGR